MNGQTRLYIFWTKGNPVLQPHLQESLSPQSLYSDRCKLEKNALNYTHLPSPASTCLMGGVRDTGKVSGTAYVNVQPYFLVLIYCGCGRRRCAALARCTLSNLKFWRYLKSFSERWVNCHLQSRHAMIFDNITTTTSVRESLPPVSIVYKLQRTSNHLLSLCVELRCDNCDEFY